MALERNSLPRTAQAIAAHELRAAIVRGDLAPGTAHLRTTIAEGKALMRALRERLSGLALPLYVLDIPGAHGKVPIGPGYLTQRADVPGHTVEDARGEPHVYMDCCTLASFGASEAD